MARQPRDRPEPPVLAEAAGLVYVTDEMPGIVRKPWGRGFTYLDPKGRRISAAVRERIASLVIPPAWTEVWICLREEGHLQATGRDQRNRKQYIYHPRWCAVRELTKFHRMIAFGEALPRLRRRVGKDLGRKDFPREKALALAVRLMESTAIRVGNESYAEENDSYGLTTLTREHVSVEGRRVHFSFRAKGGKLREVDVTDRRLARLVRQCLELPGCELFQYRAGTGEFNSVDSGALNAYLREQMGGDFTAKDFRTWTGTVLATEYLMKQEVPESQTARKKVARGAVRHVAERLGNTQATCRKYYIHPFVLEAYLAGELHEVLSRRNIWKGWKRLHRDEQAAMKLLVEARTRENP